MVTIRCAPVLKPRCTLDSNSHRVLVPGGIMLSCYNKWEVYSLKSLKVRKVITRTK